MKQYKLVHGHLTLNKQQYTAPALVTLSDEDAALMLKSGVIKDIDPEAPADEPAPPPSDPLLLTDEQLAAIEADKPKQKTK